MDLIGRKSLLENEASDGKARNLSGAGTGDRKAAGKAGLGFDESGRQRRLLVADDDDFARNVLVRGLARLGFQVVAVVDGEAALREAREALFDAAILDWVMPGLQGPDVCAELRASESTTDLPIVLLTVRSDEGEVERGYESGADEYLTKPFVLAEVEAVLTAVLERPRPRGTTRVLEPEDDRSGVEARLARTEEAVVELQTDLARLHADLGDEPAH